MRFLRLLLITLTLTSLIAGSTVVLAQENHTHNHLTDSERDELNRLQQKSQIDQNLKFLKRIEDEYNYSLSGFKQISQTLEDTKAKLKDVHEHNVTLREQLYYLDKVIEISKKKLVAISAQLARKTSHIKLLEAQIKEQNELYERQKEFVADYLEFLYMQERNYFGEDDQQLNAFRFLLADANASETENEEKYFSSLSQATVNVMEGIENVEANLKEMRKEVAEERDKIESLNGALKSEQRQLNAQKKAKMRLLQQTKGEEEIYRELLEGARKQQAEARDELYTLRSNLDLVRQKVDELGSDFDPELYKDLLDDSSREVYEFYLTAANNANISKMAWPVLPSEEKGISAYFRDSGYKARFGLAHNAIDIPIAQNSTIRSPLDCVTYKTQDNGYGYSYLILACKGGYLLTFGHIPEFLVEPGQKVRKGQPVALSGGMPGTRGAGHLTTGPHVHFEVMKDGKYRDPLEFLDFTILTYDSLPEKYQTQLRTKVKKRAKRDGLVIR